MADKAETGIGSPQYVAYLLLQQVQGVDQLNDRKKLLDAYAECLDATIGRRSFPKT